MWERLATTRRQDRALHGTAKFFNVILGIVAIPLWLIGQRLSTPIRNWLIGRSQVNEAPLPIPEPRERTMEALWADLQRIPSKIHHDPRAELRKGLSDLSPFVLSQNRDIANIGYSYPAQFVDRVFEGADGVPLAASVAVHESGGRPGLVVVHGLFSSRRFDYVREVAVTAFYDWGFNVAAIDLRSFGLSELLSDAPNTAGWKEGPDVVAAARMLKDLGSTTVGAWGVSLGGSSVLNASFADGAAEALDGGVLAVSGPAVPKRAAERLARTVGIRHPAYALNFGFRAMLRSRVRSSNWPAQIKKLTDAVDHWAAPYYELSPDELWDRAAAKNGIGRTAVPLLILHPEDDMIVKVEEARDLEEVSKDNENVRVWTLPGGMHGALDAIDKDWTYGVYRTFFERWAEYHAPPGPDLVYSARENGSTKADG